MADSLCLLGAMEKLPVVNRPIGVFGTKFKSNNSALGILNFKCITVYMLYVVELVLCHGNRPVL